MLRNSFIAAIAVIFGILASGPVLAQTPDAFPPAREGICDPLRGGTPGLYGLCVAYCEAQDLNEMFQEIKAGGNPGGKILERYRAKMRSGDLEMPCIVSSPSSCPCFNMSLCDNQDFTCELDILNVSELFAGQSCNTTQLCNNSATPNRTAQDSCVSFVGGDPTPTIETRQVQVAVSENETPGACLASSSTLGPGGADFSQNVFTGFILDFATSVTCLEEINDYDGNGPMAGDLDGNDEEMCFLAPPP